MSTRYEALPFATALLLAAILPTAILPAPASSTEPLSSRDLLQTYFEECLNEPGDYACLERFWVAEKADRVERSERVRRYAFPDLRYEVLDILVDAERAAVRCRVTGNATARDADQTLPSLDIEEAFFYRVRDGRIESGEMISDRMAVAEAMGYPVGPPD